MPGSSAKATTTAVSNVQTATTTGPPQPRNNRLWTHTNRSSSRRGASGISTESASSGTARTREATSHAKQGGRSLCYSVGRANRGRRRPERSFNGKASTTGASSCGLRTRRGPGTRSNHGVSGSGLETSRAVSATGNDRWTFLSEEFCFVTANANTTSNGVSSMICRL